MTIAAYVIIECSKNPANVVQEVKNIDGVKQAHALFGPIEAVAYVETSSFEMLDKIITDIHSINGVKGTDTRIARNL